MASLGEGAGSSYPRKGLIPKTLGSGQLGDPVRHFSPDRLGANRCRIAELVKERFTQITQREAVGANRRSYSLWKGPSYRSPAVRWPFPLAYYPTTGLHRLGITKDPVLLPTMHLLLSAGRMSDLNTTLALVPSLTEPLDVWQARVFEIAAGILKVEGYGALSLPDDLSEIARMLRDGLSEQIEASHSN